MQIQLYQEHKIRIPILQYYNNSAKVPILVRSQIQNLICITELENNQSNKQDFFDSYNRLIKNQYKIQVTKHQINIQQRT